MTPNPTPHLNVLAGRHPKPNPERNPDRNPDSIPDRNPDPNPDPIPDRNPDPNPDRTGRQGKPWSATGGRPWSTSVSMGPQGDLDNRGRRYDMPFDDHTPARHGRGRLN